MTATLLPNAKQWFPDGNGKPLAGGSVFFYIPNTSTFKSTWQDSGQTVLNTNPVILDASGEMIAYGSGAYRQVVYDVDGNLIWDQLTDAPVGSGDLSDEGTPGGAGLVGFDGNTLAEQLESRINRVVDSIAQLRALSSLVYTRAFVTGYYAPHDGGGGAYQFDPTDTSSADNGGTVIEANDGARWKLQIFERVSVKQFGAKADGTTDDSTAITNWLTYLLSAGNSGWAPEGDYSIAQPVSAPLSANADVQCSANAQFTAASGFPAGSKMIIFPTGTGTGWTFKWHGGRFDGTNIPNSAAGQANDIFGMVATNAGPVDIDLDYTTAGADWLHSGSDSHLFIAGGDSITANIKECVGAWDSGIYISRDTTGVIGGSLRATGNFSKCSTSIIVKRQFERGYIEANVVDCLNGCGTGTASLGDGTIANGGKNFTLIVNASRTENAAFLQATQGANVAITATDIGVSISGYTSAQAAGLRLQGSSSVGGTVVGEGVNAACTSNANFNGVRTEQIAITAGTLQSTDNALNVVSNTVGRSVRENDSSDRNTFTIKDFGSATAPTLVGANSLFTLTDGTARYTVRGLVNQTAQTFASLPVSPKAGDRGFVSDLVTNPIGNYGVAISSGGGTHQSNVTFREGSWTIG